MSRFVSDERVAVSLPDDPLHIIYIRPRMNVGIQNRLFSTIASIKAQSNGAAIKVGAEGTVIGLDIGAYNLALLTCNIVGWAGPDFDNVECTPQNIERLDPDDPLLDKVLSEINTRNTKASVNGKSPNLPSSNSNGSTASQATEKKRSVAGTTISS